MLVRTVVFRYSEVQMIRRAVRGLGRIQYSTTEIFELNWFSNLTKA